MISQIWDDVSQIWNYAFLDDILMVKSSRNPDYFGIFAVSDSISDKKELKPTKSNSQIWNSVSQIWNYGFFDIY